MPDRRSGFPDIPVRRYGSPPTAQAIPLRRRHVPSSPQQRTSKTVIRLGLALLAGAAAGLCWWLG